MSYDKEWKKIFVEKQTEMFAHILNLNIKYNKNEAITNLLYSMLDGGWLLSDNEEKVLIEEAIKIAVKEYELNEKQLNKLS